LTEREVKEDENSPILQSSFMQWFEGDINITIMSAINYENDVKIWLLKFFYYNN